MLIVRLQFPEKEHFNKRQQIEIPGHSFNMQSVEDEDSPVHWLPPGLGRGLVQVLCLTFVPFPHDSLHWL